MGQNIDCKNQKELQEKISTRYGKKIKGDNYITQHQAKS